MLRRMGLAVLFGFLLALGWASAAAARTAHSTTHAGGGSGPTDASLRSFVSATLANVLDGNGDDQGESTGSDQGDQNEQGDSNDEGDQGDQLTSTMPSNLGESSDQGDQNEQGDSNDEGDQGEQESSGSDQGDQNEQGDSNDQGSGGSGSGGGDQGDQGDG